MVVSDDWRGFKTLILANLYLCVYCVFVTDIIIIFNKVQRRKSFKRTLFFGQKHNLQMLAVIPFIKLQNETETTVKR